MGSVWLICAAVVAGVWTHLWNKYGYSGFTLCFLLFMFIGGFTHEMEVTEYTWLNTFGAVFDEVFWNWYGVAILAFIFISETIAWFLNENPVQLYRQKSEPFIPGVSRAGPTFKHDYLLFLLWREFGWSRKSRKPAPLRMPPPKPEPPKLKIPPILEEKVRPFVNFGNQADIEKAFGYIPKALIGPGKGLSLAKQLQLRYTGTEHEADIAGLMQRTKPSKFWNIEVPIRIPEDLRTQHQHIVAGSGAGKSQLIQHMFLNDLEGDSAVVVIDSQGDLINKLATRVPADRLILIDPQHCPPALNLFKLDASSAVFTYIFSALGMELTSKQEMVYRYLTRLTKEIGGHIGTMRDLLKPEGTEPYQNVIAGMDENARTFFAEFNQKRGSYTETKKEILNRILTLLENRTMSLMLETDELSIPMDQAINSGKVVLVSTAKAHLEESGASLLGRLFIAQVAQAVMARQNERRRTYLYIDEFQDYAEDSHVLFTLFEQARKYELGLIVAHQFLGQLPPQLQQSIAANTAIKFTASPSSEDGRKLASQMRVQPHLIETLPRGVFAAHFRGYGSIGYGVKFGRLENTPEISPLSAIRDAMRVRYGVRETTPPSPDTPHWGREGPESPMD